MPARRYFYIGIGFLAMSLVLIVGYSQYSTNQLISKYAPHVDAAMEIKLEATTAYLLLEKIIEGDRTKDIDDVIGHIDESLWYANAMMEGGRNPEGVFVPLDEPSVRARVEDVISRLEDFRKITRQRYDYISEPGIEPGTDRAYEKRFHAFIEEADGIETMLQKEIIRDADKLHFVHNILFLLALSLLVIFGYVFYRYDSLKTKYLIESEQLSENLKHALDDKDILMKEGHHRIKNNLIVLQSLLRLQMRDIKDEKAKEYFTDAQNRVKSIGMIHEMLHRSEDLSRVKISEYIYKFVKMLFNNYKVESQQIKLQFDVQEMVLDVDTTVALGLIVNELVSNALKYAFTDGRQGELLISLKKTDELEYVLSVKDNGAGLPDDFDIDKTESLGLTIVNTLSGQLDGRLEILGNGGAEFRVTFPGKPAAGPEME